MTTNRKIRVGVICGGRSAEHEVSLQSARNILEAIDRSRYDVTVIGIDRDGNWHTGDVERLLAAPCGPQPARISDGSAQVALVPGRTSNQMVSLAQEGSVALSLDPSPAPSLSPSLSPSLDPSPTPSPSLSPSVAPSLAPSLALPGARPPDQSLVPSAVPSDDIPPIDVVFPILHGPFGEDGTVQGLLKLANIPFVGAGVLGSAVGMDKDVMKRLIRDAGLPIPKFTVLRWPHDAESVSFDSVVEKLGCPFFVKPANLGSSVGISKVAGAAQFHRALEDAFSYDNKILIEEFIEGREIECSVLGNDDPQASAPGEVIPRHEFYSYDAKYVDEAGAVLQIPADLPPDVIRNVQRLAVETFKAVCCEGLARVDFFLRNGAEVLVNEINTMPGFTRISMYPKLWEHSGIPYTELVDRLIQLALERAERERRLKTSYQALPQDV